MKPFAALAVLLALIFPLSAESPKEIKYKSRDLEKVKAEINQKKEERERLEHEAEELSRAMKENQSKIRNAETSLLYTKQKGREIEQQVATTKNQHDQLLNTASQQKRDLKGGFKTYYVAAMLNTPDSSTAVLSRQVIHGEAARLKSTLNNTQATGQSLRSLIDTQQVLRGEVHKQETKLSSIRAGNEDKERQLNKKRTRQETLENEMKELRQTAEQLASLIDVLRTKAKEEAAAEKEARRQKQISGHSPIDARSLPWPMQGKVITKFGRQQHPSLGTTFVSNGIVIGSGQSEAVSAVADGKVLYAGEFMSYGPMTVVEHAGDWYTVYGHLIHWELEKGQQIKQGDRIGMARPKAGGGSESYFELRFYGKSTDPIPWLKTAQ